MFDAYLAMQLAGHFDGLLRMPATAAAQDEAGRAALQENAAYAYECFGDGIRATERLHEALATLRRLKGPGDAQTRRVARQLVAIHERTGSAHGLERVRRELDRQ